MLGSWRWLPRVGVVRAYTIHQSRGNILEIEVNFSDLLEFPKCDFGFQRGRKKFRENFAGHRKKNLKNRKVAFFSAQADPTSIFLSKTTSRPPRSTEFEKSTCESLSNLRNSPWWFVLPLLATRSFFDANRGVRDRKVSNSSRGRWK